MPKFKVRFNVPVELIVTVIADDDDEAAETARKLADEYAQTVTGDHQFVSAEINLDGIDAEDVTEEDPPGYKPVDVTPIDLDPEGTLALSVIDGWAEPTTDPARIDWAPRRAAALIPFEVINGRPVNPNGRTGRVGRNLGKWGENQAADSVVVAVGSPVSCRCPRPGSCCPTALPDPSILMIRRNDCGAWAIPGGMVDPGETASAAALREAREETGIDLRTVEPEILDRTYVADPRNTDEAWVCSTVALYRIPVPAPVAHGDDADDARWFPFASVPALAAAVAATGGALYEAHLPILETARRHLDRP